MIETDAALLRMDKITKRFPGVLALDDVSFSLREKTIHALVGQNGAGKSTLINVLNGSIRKDSGAVYLAGQEVEIGSTTDSLNLGLACIHQEMFIVPDVSVAENVFLGDIPTKGFYRKADFALMHRKAREIFAEMGVELDVRRNVRGLGVAEQQLIMIARALHRQSRILIMDEPTASLDTHEIENLFRIIRNLVASGQSVIYISHYLNEVFKIADDVTVLRNGKNIITASVSELSEELIIEHMLGYREESKDFIRNDNLGPVVLEVENLSSGKLLRDASFSIREGEVIGLAGLLGSGRTELVRTIFGADRKTAGEIKINGLPVSINSPADAVRLGLGLLTEQRLQGIIPQFSVKKNITLTNLKKIIKLFRLDQKAEENIAKQYIELLNIKVMSILQKISNLSGGNQQKVIFAKWLHSDTKILFLDEATKGIDVGAKVEILEIVLELARKGISVILISSEFTDLVRVCNRVLIMKKGRIVRELESFPSEPFLQSEVNV